MVLHHFAFVTVLRKPEITDLLDSVSDVAVIAVDIPIGIDGPYPRRADVAARAFVEERRSSVFMTPPRSVLVASDYEQATRVAEKAIGTGVSRQAFALGPKILQVDAVARDESRVIEVHPEVSFRAMAGQALTHSKKSWNGLKQREQLLIDTGIVIPSELPIPGSVAADDVLDAAAAAWSAHRYAAGEARSLPEDPVSGESLIWY